MYKYLWINLILLEIVCIFSQKISGHLTKKSNNNNYDIEFFISQLLSSQKFDELADKVAEKAVKKIQSMTPSEKFSDQKAKQSEIEEVEKENSNENIEEGEKKRVIINMSAETSQLRQNENPHRDERPHKPAAPVKINTHALLKNDEDSEQGELSLKYEYLKKHAHDEKVHNQQETDEPNPWKHLEHSKTHEKSRPSEVENYEYHSVNSEKNTNYGIKNKKTNSYSHNVRVRNINKKEYNEGRPKKGYSSNSRPQFKSEKVPRLPVIDIDEKGERRIEEITEEPLVVKSTSKEDVLQGEKKEIRKSRRGSVHRSSYTIVQESNSEEPDQNAQDSESNPGYELGELTTTKRVIRKEGNRYYTYLSGPDYEEFHKQLANEQKKNREFN